MDTLSDLLREHAAHIVGGIALVALLAMIVAIVNRHGRRLERHQEWMRRLELSVGNLHRDKRRADVRVMQVHGRATPRPPTLSDARTVEVSEDMLLRTNPGATHDPPPKNES